MIKIKKDVNIGESIGTVECDAESTVTIAITNLRGTMTLPELEHVLREARDLNKRINPPVARAAKKKVRRKR